MKTPILCVALYGLRVAAHNVYSRLIVNGTDTGHWKYVREVARQEHFTNDPPQVLFGLLPPQFDIHSTNITCGRSAFNSAAKTGIADVIAGSEIGMRVATLKDLLMDYPGQLDTQFDKFYHEGPALVYLSKAPNNDVRSYQGDGDWFKIAYAGIKNHYKWILPGKTEYNFTVPLTTPPGEYLLRFEYLMPDDRKEAAQWYINCAQINIIGPGGGTPTEFAKFPGTYQYDDVGINIPKDQLVKGYYPDEEMRLDQYIAPGPPVWTG